MCNLYSMTRARQEIINLAKAMSTAASIGNLEPLPGIFPDQMAPVVRNTDEGRVLTMMRWGMPSPSFVLKNRKTDTGVTNVRNTKSSHWRRWLGMDHRCVVPFSSFCEYDVRNDKTPTWFALSEDRPLAVFAGIWTTWTSIRKLKEGETTNDLFAFLTTEANGTVRPVHPKAMPVILTTQDEIEDWLTLPADEAMKLQRPLPDDALSIVATGARQDGSVGG